VLRELIREHKVLKGLKEDKGPKGHKVPIQVLKVLLGLKVQRVLRVHKGM
jgi:hypothetical protein